MPLEVLIDLLFTIFNSVVVKGLSEPLLVFLLLPVTMANQHGTHHYDSVSGDTKYNFSLFCFVDVEPYPGVCLFCIGGILWIWFRLSISSYTPDSISDLGHQNLLQRKDSGSVEGNC